MHFEPVRLQYYSGSRCNHVRFVCNYCLTISFISICSCSFPVIIKAIPVRQTLWKPLAILMTNVMSEVTAVLMSISGQLTIITLVQPVHIMAGPQEQLMLTQLLVPQRVAPIESRPRPITSMISFQALRRLRPLLQRMLHQLFQQPRLHHSLSLQLLLQLLLMHLPSMFCVTPELLRCLSFCCHFSCIRN
jgi:hypothetical protein